MANKKAVKGSRGKSPAVAVLNIVIIILFVAVVLAGISAVAELADYKTYDVTADSFLWRLEDEDYSGFLRLYYSDESRTEAEAEYYAIAEYLEAAFFYRAFSKADEPGRARKYLERMEQAAGGMGEFRFVKDKIDAKLCLTN